jgi:RecA-family ATPase
MSELQHNSNNNEEANIKEIVQEILSDTISPEGSSSLSKLKRLSEVSKTAVIQVPLWGDLLIRKKITHITGEPNIGKTTFTYTFGLHVSNKMEFLGITPQEPVKVLIVDFESDESLAKTKYDNMGNDFPDENLRVIFEQELYIDSSTMIEDLINIHKKFPFDIMFVDNQGTAFPIRDENDNAEAVRHIKVLRKLASLFNCAIVLYHHPSKADNEGLRKGSGAFAWVRYCDIACNLSETDKENHIVELEYTKNRFAESAENLYFQKMGMGMFEKRTITDTSKKVTAKYPVDIVANFILDMHGEFQRKEITDKCIEKFAYSVRLIDKALDKLVNRNKISAMTDKYGYYKIP